MDKLDRLDPELLLLSHMLPKYAAAVIAVNGMTDDDLVAARSLSGADFLGRLVTAEWGAREAETLISGDGSRLYRFQPFLWPDLYWVVEKSILEVVTRIGFENRSTPALAGNDPESIEPGVWTRSALATVADDEVVVDDWEPSIIRYGFGGRKYSGVLSYDLLNEWRRVA